MSVYFLQRLRTSICAHPARHGAEGRAKAQRGGFPSSPTNYSKSARRPRSNGGARLCVLAGAVGTSKGAARCRVAQINVAGGRVGRQRFAGRKGHRVADRGGRALTGHKGSAGAGRAERGTACAARVWRSRTTCALPSPPHTAQKIAQCIQNRSGCRGLHARDCPRACGQEALRQQRRR